MAADAKGQVMSPEREAYEQLYDVLLEWADGNLDIVKHPERLAKDAAEYVFFDLLNINLDEKSR